MTLISRVVNFHVIFIMENQLVSAREDYESSFLSEWQMAQEDLDFLDYTHCFRVDNAPLKKPSLLQQRTCGGRESNTDERETIINLSVDKLRRIEDPESCLRLSVLINNTLRRIKGDLTSEKSGSCLQLGYPTPCKRRRLQDTPVGDHGTTTTNDITKEDFSFDHEDIVFGRKTSSDGLIDKQLNNNKTPFASEVETSTTTCHEPRDCELRFTELVEFPNILCALET